MPLYAPGKGDLGKADESVRTGQRSKRMITWWINDWQV